MNQQNQALAAQAASDNPLFEDWAGPFGVPPFGRVAPRHFLPAFARAFAAHEAEVAAIAADAAEPTFANTIDALETARRRAHARVQRLLSPRRRAHQRRDPGGRARAGAARGQALEPDPHGRGPVPADRRASSPARRSSASPRSRRACSIATTRCTSARAPRSTPPRKRGSAISTNASPRSARPSARTCWRMSRATRSCSTARTTSPGFPISCARRRRRRPRSAASPASTSSPLSRSSVEPFLQFSARRDLREKIFRAWIARGDGGGATDNKAIIAEMVALRAERARLLGYPTFAHYRLDDAMAKTPEAVRSLLERVWLPARRRAMEDRDRAAGPGAG